MERFLGKQYGRDNQVDVIRQFTAIGLTLLLLAGSLWWLRRKGFAQWRRGRPGQLMEVIESRTLAPGHALHLVRVADRVLALATHNGGCTLLEARPWSDVRQSAAPEVQV
jgi:flagellar biogenesis protein FliO